MIWIVFALVFAVLSYLLFRAVVVEPHDLEVTHKDIHIPGLPEELDGMKIVHLSDLHLKGIGDREHRAIAAVREAKAEMVCLTGDFVAGDRGMQFLVPFLMELTSEGRRVFGVLGNHDHGKDVDADFLQETLRRTGVNLLINDVHRHFIKGVAIDTVGVDDPHTGRAQVSTALNLAGRKAEPESGKRLLVLLAHSPDVLLDERSQCADIILSGHTHGGQVRLPFIGPLVTHTEIGRSAAAGIVERDGALAHINRGLGESTFAIRLYCRPEVSILTLRPGAARSDDGV